MLRLGDQLLERLLVFIGTLRAFWLYLTLPSSKSLHEYTVYDGQVLRKEWILNEDLSLSTIQPPCWARE